MLRNVSFIVAVLAVLAISFSQADARPRGGHGAGRVHFSGGGVRHIGRVHVGPRRVFVGGHHFRHHRRFIYSVGFYDSCWRWRPTVYGWRYVWVCGPYRYPYY